LLVLEASFMNLSERFIEEGFSPYAIAAIMTKISFMIYKTTLNAEDYNIMINQISDNRDKIKSLQEYTSIKRLN
jgi:hypothetical protein